MTRITEWWTTVERVVSVAREEEVSILAAGFAHYAFTSFVPLLLLLVIGLSMVGRLALLTRASELLTGVQSWQVERLLRVTTNDVPARRRAGLLAGVILVWSAVRLSVAVNNAFSIVYGPRDESPLRSAIQVGYALATIMLAVGLLSGIGVALAFVLRGANVVLAPVVLFAVLAAAFYPMFYFFPGERISFSEALPGTVVTALFWAGSGIGFRVYATTSTSIHLYGAVGGLLLLLTWLYLGGLILMLGIILNGVVADAPRIERA